MWQWKTPCNPVLLAKKMYKPDAGIVNLGQIQDSSGGTKKI